jgi:hypothetical protein
MPSMSYCVFENTSGDLGQCLSKMNEARDIDDLDMNEYEQHAFRRMYEQCKEYIAMYKHLAADFIDEDNQ